MNDDINGNESMQRFEDLGRKLFQTPKPDEPEINEDEATQPEDDAV